MNWDRALPQKTRLRDLLQFLWNISDGHHVILNWRLLPRGSETEYCAGENNLQ